MLNRKLLSSSIQKMGSHNLAFHFNFPLGCAKIGNFSPFSNACKTGSGPKKKVWAQLKALEQFFSKIGVSQPGVSFQFPVRVCEGVRRSAISPHFRTNVKQVPEQKTKKLCAQLKALVQFYSKIGFSQPSVSFYFPVRVWEDRQFLPIFEPM